MPERGSKTSTVPVVWSNMEFFRGDPNDFLSRMVIMDGTWLYHYDPETKQQSMEWGHSGSPRPKNFECKNPLENSRLDFLGSRQQSSSLVTFQKAKLSTRNINNLCCCNWKILWKKNAAVSSPRVLVLARQCSGSPGTCNPEETGLPGLPISWSPTLFSGSGPVGLPPVPWTEKTTERSPFFVRRRGLCCRGDLVGWTNLWIFLVACKA